MSFNRNLSEAATGLKRDGYVHLENVLSETFKDVLRETKRKIDARQMPEVDAWYIPGKKRQYLFDFPSRAFLDEFRAGLGEITGHDPEKITISERHIKVYLENAEAYPAPHQDRQAAEFTIGFPIHIPEDSRVCFFPHMSREENTGERAVFATFPDGTDIKALYDDQRVRQYKGEVGDMLVFYGSTVFHERINPAGAQILYIKINAEGRDPLGEHASLMESFEPDLEAA